MSTKNPDSPIFSSYKNKSSLISVLIGICVGIVNGFFGSGGGTVFVPLAQRCLKIETHKAHATAIALILPLSIVSSIFYYSKINPPLPTLICIGTAGIIGGFIGARLLKRLSAAGLHIIFGIFMLIAAARSLLR
jgi:hypothetical protein